MRLTRSAMVLALCGVPAWAGAAPARSRASGAAAVAPPGGYLGVAACARCHADIARTWRATAHARATGALTGHDASSPRCRMCHATGPAPLGRSALPGVECEACHGPGADYAADDVMRDTTLARLMGLRDLSSPAARARLCQRCHVPGASTRLARFDPERAWHRIRHGP